MIEQSLLEACREKVKSQAQKIPALYAQVDFSAVPERFTDCPEQMSYLDSTGGRASASRLKILENKPLIELMRTYTLMGDEVADAYAALIPEYGFRPLVKMLVQACDHGLESVPEPPEELVRFIRSMEKTPDWVDMALVEEGARQERNSAANLGPYIIRGAFFATFMNKYAALPMAITSNLSGEKSARRVKETATFFTTSALPGALERYGPGFHAAAMVRLMHSMVRANVLGNRSDWDLAVYGVPIPQVDQMPAGLISSYLMSLEVLNDGRSEFNDAERAKLELSRYRCFLLGLPEELLAETPRGVVDTMTARAGTLRDGFDDETCGELIRATMAANLRPDDSLSSRTYEFFERSVSKLFFLKHFVAGDKARAAEIGMKVTPVDTLVAAVALLYIYSVMGLYKFASSIPVLRDITDRRLVARLKKQLVNYGHAEFTTDASHYRQAQPSASS